MILLRKLLFKGPGSSETGVTFTDVAGADQAKLELQVVVDFLENPDKAAAGEPSCHFSLVLPQSLLSCLLVWAHPERGICSRRPNRRHHVLCLLMLWGRQRGAGLRGGNDEREQTINQLLTEMNGFSGNSGVIVLAATNRPDVLDSALLRPGRFDRQVTVDRPHVAGRVKILQVHSRRKAPAQDVEFEKVAGRTPGFTGPDLQNLINMEQPFLQPEKKNAVCLL
ncbi:hypothetical protein AB3S75_013658 [Citrus x aurantiifolia]